LRLFDYIRPLILKTLLFLKNNLKNRKALQQNAKGLELASSPYWTRSELLKGILQ